VKLNTVDAASTGGQGGGYPTLISGPDSQLVLTPNITYFASGNFYALNTELPLNQWLDLTLIGRGKETFASVVARETGEVLLNEEEFMIMMGISGVAFYDAVMAIEAPLQEVGGQGCGWTGEFGGLTLTSTA
jgi:hexosaminidase